MLSSGFAQTLAVGIYLSHHSEQHEHLCDESHCRVQQCQAEELVKTMPRVESRPAMPMFPVFPTQMHSVVHIPTLSSVTQCSWSSDLASSLSSPFAAPWQGILVPKYICSNWLAKKTTAILSQKTPLGAWLPLFTEHPLSERCLLFKQFCSMLSNMSKGRGGRGVDRGKKGLPSAWTDKVMAEVSSGKQAQSFEIIFSQKQN